MTRANPTELERRALGDICEKCEARKGHWCRTDAHFDVGAWARELHSVRLEVAHHLAWSEMEASIARHPAGKGLGGDAA